MQLMVFGCGGVGGYMSARLGSRLGTPGYPLTALNIVARGKHLDAIRNHGLTYVDPYGNETTVHPTAAVADARALPPPEFVLLCVKGYDLEAAVAQLAEHLPVGTPILPLLNGADIDERVRAGLQGRVVVLPGAIYISAFVERPGRVRHAGGPGSLVLGSSPDNPDLQPHKFLQACEIAGVPADWRADPAPAIWEKYLFIAPFSLVTAVHDAPIGAVLEDETLRADVRAIVAETAEIARRKGVNLPDEIVELILEKASGFPAGMTTSFQRDIAAGSPRDERDIFAGTIIRHGRQLGVATPVADRYVSRLPGGLEAAR